MVFRESSNCLDRREKKNKQVWRGGHSERKEGGRRTRQRMLEGGHEKVQELKEMKMIRENKRCPCHQATSTN